MARTSSNDEGSLSGQQAVLVEVERVEGSALSMGARTLAAQCEPRRRLFDKTIPKERETVRAAGRPPPPEFEREIDLLQEFARSLPPV